MGVTAGIVQVPWLQAKLPYDPMKDLQPVAYVAQLPTALIVPTSLQINSYPELVAYLKSHRGAVSYASVGYGSSHHIFGELLSARLDAQATHVPYKGDGPALADLVPGRIHYMFSSVFEAISFSKQGKVRILAITGNSRLPAIGDVPTMEELGLQGFEMSGFSAVFAPAATPPAIVETLSAAFNDAVHSIPFTQYLESNGIAPGNLNRDEFARQLQKDHASWGKVIRANNIRID
jgi:tripartite-type tricarboxylate transporter receptor subunit TctC